jgi:hypothetical protein
MAGDDLYGVSDELAARLRTTLGASVHLSAHPGLVGALMSGHVTPDQMASVGSFVDSLELAKNVRLARTGGAVLELSNDDRSLLSVIGENFKDVDATEVMRSQQAVAKVAAVASIPDVHGFWGHVAHFVNSGASLLFDNPVVRPVLHGLNRFAEIAKAPARYAAAVGGDWVAQRHGFVNPDYTQQQSDMRQLGYDPNSTLSQLAFYSRGENVYHNLDGLRDQYGDQAVSAAQEYLRLQANGQTDSYLDPNLDADSLAIRVQSLNDPKFQEVVQQVDARHESPGRDLARVIGVRPGTAPFKVVSGATDALSTWYADPTLILGKAMGAYKASRLLLASMADTGGVARLMYNNAAVRRGWTSFLDDSRIIREGTPEEAAAAFARIRIRTPELAPLIPEINGVRVVPPTRRSGELLDAGHGRAVPVEDVPPVREVKPIETYDDLVTHVVSTNALVRLTNGLAASQAVYMPGAVSRFASRQLRALAAGRLTRNGVQQAGLDVTAHPGRYLPDTHSAVDINGNPIIPSPVDYSPSETRSIAGDIGDQARRSRSPSLVVRMAAGKVEGSFERVARRLTTLLPTATSVAYDSPEAVEQLRRFAATYMARPQANLYAAAFSNADIAGRRAIYKGVVEQLIHSAGMESTASGKKLAEIMRSDATAADKQAYSTTGLDMISDSAGVRRVGLWPAQMNNDMWFPSFAKMQQAAAKVGIWDHTVGSVLQSTAADQTLSAVRTGWLATSAGAVRNTLDDVAGYTARGYKLSDFFHTRSALSKAVGRRILERELPEAYARKAALDETLKEVPYNGWNQVLKESKDAKQAIQILKVRSWLHRAAGSTVGTIFSARDRVKAVTGFAPLSGIPTDEINKYAAEIPEVAGANLDALDGIGRKAPQSTVIPDGREEAEEIVKLGLTPKPLNFVLSGWHGVSTDGEAGARAWAHNLDLRMTDDGLGKAVLAFLDGGGRDEEVQALADMIRTEPALENYRRSSELLSFLHDKTLTKDEINAHTRDLAARLTADMLSLVQSPEGEAIGPLIKYMRQYNRAPSVDWIERNIPNADRPGSAISRKYVALPAVKNKTTGVLQGYANTMTRFFDMVVNKPSNYLTRQPIYAVNYVLARRNLAPYEQALVDGGMDEDRAAQITMDLSRQHAWDKTVTMIDNPEVQTQFAVLSRNFVNFYRAQHQFIERWARAVKDNPAIVRKAQLAMEAGLHSGVIDRDENGNPIFVYPGSGAVISAMIRAADKLPGVDLAQIPAVPNLTSQVMFLNPSLDNPVQLSFSPVVSMPLKTVEHFFPEHALGFSQAETIALGAQGAGRSWWSQFMPTTVTRFMGALSGDDQKSQVASAVRNAIVNLDAAGQLPGKDATPDEVDQYIGRLKNGAKSQLFVRSLFAFFLPAAPSLPEETTGDASKADPLFQAQGLRTLKQEFRVMVDRFGYEKALAVWTKLHPDELAYTIGTTKSSATDAFVPPTDQALQFMQTKVDLFKQYSSVAPYFLPEAPGEFSAPAWNAELAQNLREYKDLDQFYTDVRVVGAQREYYDAKKRRDDALAAANAAGNSDLVRAINDDWSKRSQAFMSVNPLFAQKLAGYGEVTRQKERALVELQQLIDNGRLSELGGDDTVAEDMLGAYRSHTAFTDAMRGRADYIAEAQKQAEQRRYAAYQQALIDRHPEMRDLYNGLFSGLN